ncbi:MAG: simple sugar transport system permease protein [Halanaerobium sp. 4-GBenrich]|jgi:simple sugar transport system permease protein|uniref:Nucleoside ABC transporter membrane protein n=1 Tax=Halanaerobium congolense TaxID=54121 RepID=A0A1G6P628_9FIRM|nr:ABC transporter permease [Halanaerobium congolense]KXS50335.1 MAG: simple sugar transport system permease protein [Halanaerobium sp. T82-1]ODS49650.1 MAG: simple sugar transport system permease protein [Halanaerobium sp. 4-GBenrich]OEG62873.1 MAG: branched-chain amino acid ABC transporter permease [Halanaerobium sp. MDAL1]PUU91949.1 MAG: simple sugar transport system permease protein [Halanaerobium sp.]TDP11533.1 nucleoside ABC transporter membrane protein [Halanaerobium congolense]
MDTLLELISLPLILSSFRFATPLILAALGGIFSEKSGVINIALEGIMLFGAFAAVLGSAQTGNPWMGVLYAMVGGVLFAAILAIVSIVFRADQIVIGTGINIFASGITIFLLQIFFNVKGTSPLVPRLPFMRIFDVRFSVLTYVSLILVPVVYYFFYKTHWGLRIRSIGEHPAAADTLGINVNRWRFLSVLMSGVLAGLAGAHLSIGDGSAFVREMSAGRGFIALAAMIFGKWHPVKAFGAAMLFGYAEAVAVRVDFAFIPSELISAIPYVVTIVVLAGFISKSVGPAASGEAYVKGDR